MARQRNGGDIEANTGVIRQLKQQQESLETELADSRINHLVVNENAATYDEPPSKGNLDSLACSFPVSYSARQSTAECESFVFILRFTIDDKPFT